MQQWDALRLWLLTEGVGVTADASDYWRAHIGGALTLGEYATTSGPCLVLPGDRYVNASLVDPSVDLPKVMLDVVADALAIVGFGEAVAVTAVRVPEWTSWKHEAPDGVVRPLSSYGVTHSDRCRVSPIAGCAWRCQFCQLPYEFAYRRKDVEGLLAAIHAAAADPHTPARHVLVSGGTPFPRDYDWFDGVVETLVAHSPVPVDVMMPPRRDTDHLDRLAAAGVRELSLNMEIFDDDRRTELMPQKAAFGRDAFLRYVERAVEVFGAGRVQSLVLVGDGVEPIESTLRGVDELVNRGCVPVLSPFRPHSATPLHETPALTYQGAVHALEAVEQICARDGLVLPGTRCVACQHNTIAAPMGRAFYDFPEAP